MQLNGTTPDALRPDAAFPEPAPWEKYPPGEGRPSGPSPGLKLSTKAGGLQRDEKRLLGLPPPPMWSLESPRAGAEAPTHRVGQLIPEVTVPVPELKGLFLVPVASGDDGGTPDSVLQSFVATGMAKK